MKNIFFEYYPINEETIDEIWKECIFCYDTNVLLNLYRYTEETKAKMLEVMEYFKPQSILPYQVAFEFHKNRRSTIRKQVQIYDDASELVELHKKQLVDSLLKLGKHSVIDINAINSLIKKYSDKITKGLKEQKKNHPDLEKKDAINDKIAELFEGKVSSKFSDDVLKQVYKEGKDRYDKKVPPGYADYKDKKNNDENSLFGDLIIWKQLFEIAKEKRSNIIFVTDDRKEDWWLKVDGKTIGPRPELYKEFSSQTDSKRILIYNAEQFITYGGKHSSISIQRKVINEINTLMLKDDEFSRIRKELSELELSPSTIMAALSKISSIYQPNFNNILTPSERHKNLFSMPNGFTEEDRYRLLSQSFLQRSSIRDTPNASIANLENSDEQNV